MCGNQEFCNTRQANPSNELPGAEIRCECSLRVGSCRSVQPDPISAFPCCPSPKRPFHSRPTLAIQRIWPERRLLANSRQLTRFLSSLNRVPRPVRLPRRRVPPQPTHPREVRRRPAQCRARLAQTRTPPSTRARPSPAPPRPALPAQAASTTRPCPRRRDRGAGVTTLSTSRPGRVRDRTSRSAEKFGSETQWEARGPVAGIVRGAVSFISTRRKQARATEGHGAVRPAASCACRTSPLPAPASAGASRDARGRSRQGTSVALACFLRVEDEPTARPRRRPADAHAARRVHLRRQIGRAGGPCDRPGHGRPRPASRRHHHATSPATKPLAQAHWKL